MILEFLSLTNFRNYSSANFTFSPTTTLVVGPNASGKTNLLEATYFLATGKSYRAGFEREVIRGGEGFARIKGVKGLKGIKEEDDGDLEVTILANENGENTSSKRLKVNGVKKRLSDFAGNLRAVYFGPEEIELVTGPPSRRRRYLDSVLCQVDREYARSLLEYEKVLRQRNRLLLILREEGLNPAPHRVRGKGVNEQLEFWDEKLLVLAEVISSKRAQLIDFLNLRLEGKLKLIVYQSKRSPTEIYDWREREIAAGMTLWGPHRDDFGFFAASSDPRSQTSRNPCAIVKNQGANLNGLLGGSSVAAPWSTPRDLSTYGSRGEQRLAVLHLKLAELEFITERAGDRPILLLDDIFSELDEDNRALVFKLLGKQQTIITTTDIDQIDSEKRELLNCQIVLDLPKADRSERSDEKL